MSRKLPALIVLLLVYAAPLWAVQFSMGEDVINSNSGHVRIVWKSDKAESFQLQQAEKEGFEGAKTIYNGPDKASFISGLADGSYYYRVKAENGEWSKTLTINVEHQSLNLAFTLFGIGALVFLLTVWVVVNGTRQVKKEAIA